MKTLEGVRVIDLTQAYSGPFCTMHLADHGAEVITIEKPGMGDQTRDWGSAKNDCSTYYAFLNRNKKSLKLDLRSQEGKDVFFQLVKNADVVCENFKVGTMEKLGLGYEEIKKVNQQIIYASISEFELTGPLSKFPAYDIIDRGMSGLMNITVFPDSPPTKVGPYIDDNYSGTYLALGICMALYHRERTGEGQRIDAAMMDSLYSILEILENAVVKYTAGGYVPGQEGNVDSSIIPFDFFKAKDGVIVLEVDTNAMYARFCKVIEREDLINQPLYCTNIKRSENYLPGLKAAIEAYTRTKTKAELEKLMVEAGIPFGTILSVGEASEHPRTKAREILVEVDHPVLGKIRIPGVPIKMYKTPGKVAQPAPLLGQHNEEILTNLGYSKESINQLRDRGVI